MPELPEVEVTKRGISLVLEGSVISKFIVRTAKLRTPISSEFDSLRNLKVKSIVRRGKYILIFVTEGAILIHLGMSGHLRIVSSEDEKQAVGKHDHVDIVLTNGNIIRFNDQRKFGLFEWYPSEQNPYESAWLKSLGPEPLDDAYNGKVLYASIAKKRTSIKQVIMDSHVLVGVGNIYASESLFKSCINPFVPACTLSLEDCERLVSDIKEILSRSILAGGTTIRDFSGADGMIGHFVENLLVYGHVGKKCPECGSIIQQLPIGGRSTFYCPVCQSVDEKTINTISNGKVSKK